MPQVPPGQSPPFAAVTDTDHRAWVYYRNRSGHLGDAAIFRNQDIRLTNYQSWLGTRRCYTRFINSYLLRAIVAHFGSVRGRTWEITSLEQQSRIQKMYYASNLLFLVSLSLSKTSVILLLRRLTPFQDQNRCIRILLGLVAAWTIADLFVIALQGGIPRPWIIFNQKNSTLLLRLEISEIVASLFELAVFLMAVWLVWNLETEIGKKIIVVTAFSFRLVMVIVTVFRLESFDKAGFTVDATLREASYICWTQTELNYSIISATIIIGRQFVGVLVTNYGSGLGLSGSYTRSGGATHDASFQSTLNSRWRPNRVKADSKDRRDLSPLFRD